MNPNKEAYYLNSLPSKTGDSLCYLVKVDRQVGSNVQGLVQKINQKLPVNLINVSSSTLWEIGMDSSSVSNDDVRTFVENRIICSQNREAGILVNPIFESYKLLDPVTIYESILT